MFGLLKKSVAAPREGTIESISDATGQILLRAPPIPVEINAYIPGKVVKVIEGEGVIIETVAAFIQGIFGIGGETKGEIRVAVNSPQGILTPDGILPEDKGSVLISGSMVTYEALLKAVEVGVNCIVTGSIKHRDLIRFSREEIGVAITGQEEIGLTLIVTEGFGVIPMSERSFELLGSFEGEEAIVNGTTQIRAGVLRPEIIIPHNNNVVDAGSEETLDGMVPGTLVRIIRQPFFGTIVTVYSLPVELQQLEQESYMRVLEVELRDSSIITVP